MKATRVCATVQMAATALTQQGGLVHKPWNTRRSPQTPRSAAKGHSQVRLSHARTAFSHLISIDLQASREEGEGKNRQKSNA